MELGEYERKHNFPNRNHSYICTTQYLVNNPKQIKTVHSKSSNNNYSTLAKKLQNENERLQKVIKTYQIKYEMFTSKGVNSSNVKDTNKYQINKLNKLIVNTNDMKIDRNITNNKTLSLFSTLSNKFVHSQKITKTKHSSTSTTPKQKLPYFINKSSKKIMPSTKVNSSRKTTSYIRQRLSNKINHNQCSDIHTICENNSVVTNDIKNSSSIIGHHRYKNLLDEFAEIKIITTNKKERNTNNDNKRKIPVNDETIQKFKYKKPKHIKQSNSISTANPDVIINNVNYINVYPTNYTHNNNNNTKVNILKHRLKHSNINNKKQ